jgi:hypothetical protein
VYWVRLDFLSILNRPFIIVSRRQTPDLANISVVPYPEQRAVALS